MKDVDTIKKWFYGDAGSVSSFVAWAEANLSEQQQASLDELMFPALPDEKRLSALEELRKQAQALSVDSVDEKNVQDALTALDKAIEEARKLGSGEVAEVVGK